jgi:protein-S-isoprenylcysteine O-methyltransferase Ste14
MLENRIPPVAVALLCALLMWLSAPYLSPIEARASLRLAGTATLLIVGLTVALAGVLSFRAARTTVNPHQPQRASSLVVSGIFRYSRNPMYLGLALLLVAWAVWLLRPPLVLGVVLFVLYMNRFQIAPEERAMERIFGEDYVGYRRRVRRWL